jgi:hypothetical protein
MFFPLPLLPANRSSDLNGINFTTKDSKVITKVHKVIFNVFFFARQSLFQMMNATAFTVSPFVSPCAVLCAPLWLSNLMFYN